jgi:1-acyl-sn-glycerol-3-phosphate acyltransferase
VVDRLNGQTLDRRTLTHAILSFLANQDTDTLAGVREAVERELDAAGDRGFTDLLRRLAVAGSDWSYFAPDPLARRIHDVIAARLLGADSCAEGLEHLQAVAGQPVVICSNHLSYADANVLEILLRRSGAAELADRLTAIAGPKVYSSLKRRFSSLCFGTIKTPQSSTRSSEDAVMNAREVARAARLCIDLAGERLRSGDALLLFPEGTRSRTTAMQRMLPAVTRYLDEGGAWILPVGITGTEVVFPVGEDALHPNRIVVRAGPPVRSDALRMAAGGDRRLMIDAVGLAIGETLPLAYAGAYAPCAPDLDDARRVLATARGATGSAAKVY